MTAEAAAADQEWMAGLSASVLTRTSQSLRTVRTDYACQPPACEGAGQLTPRRHARTSPGRVVRTGTGATSPRACCTYRYRGTSPRACCTYRVPWHYRSAWLEETLVDEAMGDDALDDALCAEIAARRARRQAVERLRVEEVLRVEAKKADDKLKEMEKELRKAELARLEAKRLARDAKEYALLEAVLYDPGSIALC